MISGYRLMWLMVMFDLPVQTKKDRKLASKFRNDLLDLGFCVVNSASMSSFASEQREQNHLSIH